MENKFLLFIIGIIILWGMCWATGSGFGAALLDDGDEIRILSHDAISGDNGVSIVGDKNTVEYTTVPESEPETTDNRGVVVTGLLVLSIIGIALVFKAASNGRDRAYDKLSSGGYY